MYCSEINDLNGPVIYSRFKYFYKEGIFLQLMKKSYNSLSKRVFQIMDGKYEHDEDVNFNDEFSGDEDEGTAQ